MSQRAATFWVKPALGLVALIATAAPAAGGITYHYTAGQSSYAVSPGQVLNVPVYLRETVTGADTSLLESEDGLFGAGFSVATTGAPVSFSLSPNTADFSGPSSSTATSLLLGVGPSDDAGPLGTPVSAGVREVLLGTISLTAGSDDATFNLAAYNSLGGNTLTFTNFLDLDVPLTSASYTAAAGLPFTVVVPEPATAALLILAPLATLVRRRRA